MCVIWQIYYTSMYYIDAINVYVQLIKHISIKAIHYDYAAFPCNNDMFLVLSTYYGSKIALDDRRTMIVIACVSVYVRPRCSIVSRSSTFQKIYWFWTIHFILDSVLPLSLLWEFFPSSVKNPSEETKRSRGFYLHLYTHHTYAHTHTHTHTHTHRSFQRANSRRAIFPRCTSHNASASRINSTIFI